ncbi:hypothetical protein [Parachitinimonas caeni]|uniref:Uncharacterized protein n=1 Tax=Parachitinimonas caeni TaxID=3031301 RepID=A0ABT7E1Q1_9NEIS|nr:hypothetical protein [Parachitinimonas caeni]MDK2126241.1 hypothetical protein [Parachitinimonas caeni]
MTDRMDGANTDDNKVVTEQVKKIDSALFGDEPSDAEKAAGLALLNELIDQPYEYATDYVSVRAPKARFGPFNADNGYRNVCGRLN